MLFLANSDGTIRAVVPSVITQGSNLAQTIYLVSPSMSVFSVPEISFILPGSNDPIDGGVMLPSDPVIIDGVVLNAFAYKLTKSLTNYNGIVQVGFGFYTPETHEELRTYSGQFMVTKALPPELPEEPTADVYEQLVEAYAYLLGRINTGELEAKGIFVYDINWSYSQYALTYSVGDDGYIEFYWSLVADNYGNALTDTSSWQKLKGLSQNDLTDELKANYDDAVEKAHTHNNKALLDTYTQTEENLASAVGLKHSHSNKTILDNTTASYTTEEQTRLANTSGTNTGDETESTIKTKLGIIVQTLTDAESISWNMNLGSIGTITLAGSRALATPTNLKAGVKYVLEVTQDAVGSRVLTYSEDFRFTGGIAPVLSSTANAVDILEFISLDGETLMLTNFLPDLKAVSY